MKVIDLRPDPKLLKSNFDGYKLSLEAVPILRLENIKPVHKIQQSSAGYSFLHSCLFQLENHLINDMWNQNSAYYIDNTLSVQKIQYEEATGKLKNLFPVYKFQIDPEEKSSKEIYNTKVIFVSEKFAVLSDGYGTLQIINTGDRFKSEEWKKIHESRPLTASNFIIQDAKLTFEKGEKIIHCLLLHIEQIDEKFYNIINWVSLKEEAESKKWNIIAQRTVQGKGSLYYLSLDVFCKGIVYSSNHEYKYTFDSVNEIIEEAPTESKKSEQCEPSVHSFTWNQNGEDITINFSKIENSTSEDYKVICMQSHIEVKYQDQILLNSDIFAEVDVDLTTWNMQNEFLQLNLIKKRPELIWPYLIPSGPPEDTSNSSNMELLGSQPVTDLNSQIEECDFGDDGTQSDEYFIERIDSSAHKTSHKVFLGSNHPLFVRSLRPGFPKAIATRCDVDCCLWLQNQTTPESEWTLKNDGILHAFAYVSASKRDRKYLMCSNDMNTSIICESARHIFIYKNTHSSAANLRKRTGPQISIGEQKLIALDASSGEIFGLTLDNNVAFLLTENAILCLQLNVSE